MPSDSTQWLDLTLVKNGDLSQLTEAERECYRIGESRGVELTLSCVRGNRWRMKRIWQRIFDAT